LSDIEPGYYVVLSVQDNGQGISHQDLEHIFEPFYTRKKMGRSGTGLGLSVVWNTIQDHKGKISVKSSESGTCFKLYFPVSREPEISPENRQKQTPPTGSGELVLVVDDEPNLRDIASKMLRAQGYSVDSVSSGEQALEFLAKKQAALLVIDMQMEPGMNGRETYEKILGLYPGQRAIIASGYSESDEVTVALSMGAGGFIRKPYTLEELARTVRKALLAATS
jgi:CheY-like chemotaxis protein